MKDVNTKPTGMNSLGLKFSVVVFIAITVAGLVFAYAVLWLQEQALSEQQLTAVQRTAKNYARQVDAKLDDKEKAAILASQVISRYLTEQRRATGNIPRPGSDNIVRQQDSFSAATIPAANLKANTSLLFSHSQLLWQQLSPLMLQEFSAFYFVSEQQFIRVAPADLLQQLNPQHDLTADLYYRDAIPDNNPAKLPRWTPVYYHPIWQEWVISILVPVFVKEQFVGVSVADLELSELTRNTNDIGYWSRHTQTLLFDAAGQAIAAEGGINTSQVAGNMLYPGEPVAKPALREHIRKTLQPSLPDVSADNKYLFAAAPLKHLNWQAAVYVDKAQVMATLKQFRGRVVVIFIAVAIALAALLHLVSYQFVLKRLNRLSGAVVKLSRGDIQQVGLDNNKDEIGVLNRAFAGMSAEIAQLVTGLNARIAEKEQAERAARKLSKAVSFSSSGILLTDPHLNIEYLNPFLTDLLGCDERSVVDQPLNILLADEMEQLSTEITQTLSERQHWRGDILLQHQKLPARQFWVSLAIAPIRDEIGTLLNYVCAMQDISFIKQSQKQMEHLAYYDILTGLANRSYFRDQLRKAIAMAHRGYYNFALLYFDLDEFKRINDTLGHDAGDELLKEVARRLTSRLREEDTIARLGGDEFAVILSGIKDRQQASTIATNLQQAFHEPVKLGHHDVAISASIGITVAPEDASEEELLLKHADLAMYEAKARGKNTFHFFSQDLNDAANERLQIENQLREAIRENQFLLYFQPKVDIRTEIITGYETLIRWLRPDNTLVPPVKFIPVAESTGLIVQIGEWIIWEACRFLARQQSRGYDVTLSINLSVRQFNDQDLPLIVERVLKRTGVKPRAVIFEITESMLMGDTDAAINQLNQLKRLGVSLSIDDFGTGYSSLSYLKRFPVDELKIDRSFVKDIPQDRNDMDIVAAIIAMAQKMNLRVVAEGVETAQQVEFLRNNGCFEVQGYFYSMPLAEQELSQLNYTVNT
ncbi:PAS domain S-box-containing protein/diguanylate cyclase (GGDEF) domain-containing protein [Arsukibacterium tuosuense]|uniref:cyclic-guanylate-specific phosphodiesterase n=1 Tax=Arsukibacterium tuosuense TaxID=1323745 RepID=A0A285IEQ3_9GAMM|nr:EAL domain-containing protein [Arsukibacterium tuosuense]SNY46454.1 PAS domain S-box-containing protein/diguanylate cyclase (GGDEF) domain-containing protein [Arsukibacterium tuosuense]